MLNDRFHLTLIGEAVRELDINVAKMINVYEGYLFGKKNNHKTIQVSFNIDPTDAWHVATKVEPSLWEFGYGEYRVSSFDISLFVILSLQFTLSDVRIGDRVQVGKSTAANTLNSVKYYAIETTTTTLHSS